MKVCRLCMSFVKFSGELSEHDESLAHIIQTYEYRHAQKHGEIIRYCCRATAEHHLNQRSCRTVGNKVADTDIGDEAENNPQGFLLLPEGEILVQEITHDASHNVIQSRGHPVAGACDVVHEKHHTGTHQGIDYSHYYESHEGTAMATCSLKRSGAHYLSPYIFS